MARGHSGVKQVTWIICLVLFLVAVAAQFNIIHPGRDIAIWSWILGYALLLVANQVRGL